MKRDLMKILVCPICKGKLELTVDKEDEREIISGSLYCPTGKVRYTIADGIPDLLPPEKHG